MASGTNWFHRNDIFDSYIRYLCHKIGFAWASLILSSVILIVSEFMAYLVPSISTWLLICVNTFNLVISSFANLGITLTLP